MTNSIQAIILAGGEGRRLRPLTNTVPKPLVKLLGKPILDHLIESLARQEIDDFIVATGYLSERVTEHVTSRYGDGPLRIRTVDSGIDVPIVDRLKACIPHVCETKDVLICYGDTLADVDVAQLRRFHAQHPGTLTITSYPLRSKFGVLKLASDGGVLEFKEKPILNAWINIGFFVADAGYFPRIERETDFATFVESTAKAGQLYSFVHSGFHFTVNDIVELQEAEEELAKIWKLSEPGSK